MKFVYPKTKKDFSDQEMISGYKHNGNLELLGQLYSKYMPLVYGLCMKYFKDEERSKDAVMQIFEQLIDKLKIHEVTHFKSWLYTLVRNFCLMEIRASGKKEWVNLDDHFMENDAGQHLNIDEVQEQQLTQMEKCMEKLPDEQRISIDLFYLQQKCYKEVADITGYDLNKVKSYIQNGKRNLKICIEKNIGND